MKMYYEALGGEEEEITFAELQEKVEAAGPDVTVALDWIDDEGGLHFSEMVYGMYY